MTNRMLIVPSEERKEAVSPTKSQGLAAFAAEMKYATATTEVAAHLPPTILTQSNCHPTLALPID